MQGYREKKANGNASIRTEGSGPIFTVAIIAIKLYSRNNGVETGEEDVEYTEDSIDAEIVVQESLLLDLAALRTDIIATLA